MLVSSVVSAFEFVVAALPIVMSFQSLILDMAGNVGTQSLAVTIRALTDDSISVKDKLALLSKEARVGVLNGLILAVFAVVGIGIYIYRAKGHNIHFAFGVSLCIGLALILAMLISSIVGTCIPMFFKRIRRGSCGCFRSAYHNGKRPCCDCGLLRFGLAVAY